MKMKAGKFILIAVLFAVSAGYFTTDSYAQVKKSRKELLKENDKLRREIDSLKNLLGDEIEVADSIATEDDTINVSGNTVTNTEIYEIDTPGTNPDSLLSIWYLQKQLANFNTSVQDVGEHNYTSDIPDEVFIENIKKMNSIIPIPYNNVVKNYIVFYTQKTPHRTAGILGLAKYYIPMFEEIFDSYNMPKELAAVAIIESALNPFAVSVAKAKGMWQFMYTTGKQYDLEISSYVDERLDPEKSCHAAARYLRDAYAIFGDWALAISSYNCGAGNVNKAIRRAGSRDFWSIYPYLPTETRGYVPAFVGALYMLNYYQNYNIVPNHVQMPAHVDTFKIYRNLHFEQISENLDISVDELRQLNPQYLNNMIPASTNGYILKLPYTLTSAFIDKAEEIYKYKDSIYFNPIVYNKYHSSNSSSTNAGGGSNKIYHKVRKGQTLASIAKRYGVTTAQLKRWNRLKSNYVRVGQTLAIVRGNAGASSGSSASGSTKSSSKTTGSGYTTYTVKNGDSLYSIAKKHNMSLNDLLKLNGLTTKSKIYAGRKIKVKK